MEEKIVFNHVNFDYEISENNEVNNAIFDLNIEIKKGEFVCLIGRNGSGKSTFAKLSNAILIPDSGKITVDGLDTSDIDNKFEIRKKVGLIFQNPDNQIVATAVDEDVAFGPENLGLPREEIVKRVNFALDSVDMTEYKNYEPHKLSGGQKQRVAIAGVIAMKPDYIFFDESTAMLDPIGRQQILELAKKLNEELKIGIIFITHHMRDVALFDRVIVLNEGKIAVDDNPKKIFSNPEKLKMLGLSLPEVSKLVWQLKSEGIDLGTDITNIDEFVDAFYLYLKKIG
ncbi:MAG: energy-coupling factor transporter ATPase [Clostridia bacterium]|nr:energy-coupling factor transporter ATPase [Clostridia bacterium]